jgi:AGZA family xanthine/uracil permease-like MFS transporter
MATLGFVLIVALDTPRHGRRHHRHPGRDDRRDRAGQQKFGGIFDVPPSIAPVFLQMDLAGALKVGW